MHMATISHWQHYLPPVEEWAAWMGKDIANMKKVGMNALAVHVDWYDIEVAPGQYDFTRLDRLMDMAEANGLRVLLWPWPELQPDWVPRHVKGSEWVASDDYKPGQACWDHPEVRAMIDKFVRAVVARYKDRPSVLAWDLGAEAGIWVASNGPVDKASDARLFCYCPHTVARYRDWLRGKYGTLDKLNETWATYYTDWQQVMPVRRSGSTGASSCCGTRPSSSASRSRPPARRTPFTPSPHTSAAGDMGMSTAAPMSTRSPATSTCLACRCSPSGSNAASGRTTPASAR
jgi:beta-galactosidase GanA